MLNGCLKAELLMAKMDYDNEMNRLEQLAIEYGLGSVYIKKKIVEQDYINRMMTVRLELSKSSRLPRFARNEGKL